MLLFLASVARFYHPGLGFTPLIGFPAGDETEMPALRAIPHYRNPIWASYDGQFYAQRAFDPLVRDPDADRAMDVAPYRARRVLFSWTAFALGLGRPAWILEAYALQNVLCWLLLAVLLMRWMAPTSARGLALWTACLFSHGLLWSVRFALLDGPSLLLVACAVALAERNRPLLSAAVSGIAGLGRETNLLALAAQPPPRNGRAWIRTAAAGVLGLLPLLIWQDYLRSIYRSTVFAGSGQLAMPASGLLAAWQGVLRATAASGVTTAVALPLCLLTSLAVQAAYVVVRPEPSQPWWKVALSYAGLMLVLDRVVADPHSGGITRVLLPLTVGFNVLLSREARPRRFWPWFLGGNLHLAAAWRVLPLF